MSRAATFIGREAELVEISTTLGATRLLTLTGPGGVGKTRMAVEAARRLHLGDRHLVDLGAVRTGGLVATAVLKGTGGHEVGGRTALDLAVQRLQPRPAFVVLDNCEHLLSEVAEVLTSLLAGCPDLRVLATSRTPLGVSGETVWRVPPLSIPAPDAQPAISAVIGSDAGRLFVDRAARSRHDFSLTPEAGAAVVAICRQLDGLPLAITLAAARAGELSISQIASGLDDRLSLYAAHDGVPERHRSLRASLEWSHGLLDDERRALFRRLAVFEASFDVGSVAVVCAENSDEAGVATLLSRLADAGLVELDGSRGTMLDTVREYAAEQLADAGETEELRARHLCHFGQLAGRADTLLQDPAGRMHLQVESPNLRAALTHALVWDPPAAMDMAAGLARFWVVTDRIDEGRQLCARVLDRTGTGDPARRALVLWAAALLAVHGMDGSAAHAWARRASPSPARPVTTWLSAGASR